MSSGHPHEWLKILARIKSLASIQLIIGNGKLGTLVDCMISKST